MYFIYVFLVHFVVYSDQNTRHLCNINSNFIMLNKFNKFGPKSLIESLFLRFKEIVVFRFQKCLDDLTSFFI